MAAIFEGCRWVWQVLEPWGAWHSSNQLRAGSGSISLHVTVALGPSVCLHTGPVLWPPWIPGQVPSPKAFQGTQGEGILRLWEDVWEDFGFLNARARLELQARARPES